MVTHTCNPRAQEQEYHKFKAHFGTRSQFQAGKSRIRLYLKNKAVSDLCAQAR